MPWQTQVAIRAITIVVSGSTGSVLAYSGTPALGNLIASISGVVGTDSYGNGYLAGVTAYIYDAGGNQFAASLSTEISTSPALSFENLSSPGSINPAVYGNNNLASGTFNQLVLSSGNSTGVAPQSSITLQDNGTITVSGTNFAVDGAGDLTLGSTAMTNAKFAFLNGLSQMINFGTGLPHIGAPPTAANYNTVVDRLNAVTNALEGNGYTA